MKKHYFSSTGSHHGLSMLSVVAAHNLLDGQPFRIQALFFAKLLDFILYTDSEEKPFKSLFIHRQTQFKSIQSAEQQEK